MNRWTRTTISLVALVAVAVGAGVVLTRRADAGATEPAPVAVTSAVAVERGDVSVSESVDGTVEETDTITVVHRIEGQTPSAPTNQTTASSPAVSATVASAMPAGLVSQEFTATDAVDMGMSVPVVAFASLVTVDSVQDSAANTPTGSAPTDTTGTTTPVDTSTTVPVDPPTSPVDTAPVDTAPVDTAPVDTAPVDIAPVDTAPTTTTPVAPRTPSSAAGGALPGAAASSAGSAAPSTTTTSESEVVTGVATVGSLITSGDVLYSVESLPVVALTGELPAWRTMSSSSDDGTDIAQLEAALVALGYDPDATVSIDSTWDTATTAMVERWQVGLGGDDTGVVTLGSIVFIPHTAAVASTAVVVGDEVHDGDTVLELTGTVQQVVIEVPVELQADVTPSMGVDIGDVPGTVTRLRSADVAGDVTVQALISPDSVLDVEPGATVAVTISSVLASDELIVPTDAVVSRLDGSYALQSVDAAGARLFVPVRIVAVSGNRTAVSAVTEGDLSESTVIFEPS